MPPKTNDRREEKLRFDAPVKLLKGSDAELSGFEILAYTGAEVERWWGRLAIDLDGIRAAQQMPIFRDHDPGKIVGYSTESRAADGGFSVRGVFSGAAEAAAEVRALAAEGFPWQASIGVQALQVLELAKGQSREVNGREIQGPAEIWLESRVSEVSFVPLGADAGTKVTVFSEREEEPASSINQEEGREPMTLEELKKEHPELAAALKAEIFSGLTAEELAQANPALFETLTGHGAKLERARIADVRAQLIPGHEELIARLELDGKSDGADAAKAIVAAERELRKQAAESLAATANPPAQTAGEPESGKTTMKREAFNALSLADQAKTISDGVKLVD